MFWLSLFPLFSLDSLQLLVALSHVIFLFIIKFFEQEDTCDHIVLRIMELQSHVGNQCYSKNNACECIQMMIELSATAEIFKDNYFL